MARSSLTALLLAALALPGLSSAATARSEAALDSLLVAVDLEKRARVSDVEELDSLTGQVARAQDAASGRRARLVSLAKEQDTDATALLDAEDAVLEAEARLRALEERRRSVASRLVDRTRRIVFLSEEIARRRSGARTGTDPVTGRWSVVVDPGNRRGTMRLSLDGTIVSGEYVLDGGFRGSVRGTFVSDKLSLQRIDSERGFDANFYGRVNAAQKRIGGTWESTTYAPLDGPAGGTWSATLAPDREDSTGGERP